MEDALQTKNVLQDKYALGLTAKDILASQKQIVMEAFAKTVTA